MDDHKQKDAIILHPVTAQQESIQKQSISKPLISKESDKKPSKSYEVLFDYIPALVMSILVALEIAYLAATYANKLNSDAIPYSIIDFVKVSWLITALMQFSTEKDWLLKTEYILIALSNLDLLIYLNGKPTRVYISYFFRNYSIIILSFPFFMERMNKHERIKRLPVALLIAMFKALSTSAVFSIFILVFNGDSSSGSSSTVIYLVSTFSIIIFILETALLAVANNRLNIPLFIFHLGLLICVIVNFILIQTDFDNYDSGTGQLIVYIMQTALIGVVVFILVYCNTKNNKLFEQLRRVLNKHND